MDCPGGICPVQGELFGMTALDSTDLSVPAPTTQAPRVRRDQGRRQPLPLAPEQIQAVWSLGEWIDCRRTARGSSNLSFFVDTDRGAFVLRLSNDRKTETGMDQEVALLEHLSQGGLPVPRVVPTVSGDPWVRIGGTLCLVTARLIGEHGDPADADHARQSGRALARFHALTRSLPVAAHPRFGSDMANLAATGRLLEEAERMAGPPLEGDERHRLTTAVEYLTGSWAAASAAADGADPWPEVVTHGSLGSTAVLFHEGRLSGFLDVERAAGECRALDIAYTIRGYTRDPGGPGLDLPRMRAVMAGYRQVAAVPEAPSLPLALQVQRLLKIRRKAANFVANHGGGPVAAKDALKILGVFEDEVGRIGWLAGHTDDLAAAAAPRPPRRTAPVAR